MWLQTKMRFSLSLKHGLAFLLTCVLLSGCGFHLKKASYLPEDLKTLYVSADDTKSELFNLLAQDLKKARVELMPARQSDHAQLHLYRDSLERQTLSLFKNGQVAQYELAYAVSYRITRPGQEPMDKSFELYRNYQDDPNSALAKAKELEIILAELRQLASKRIIRELSQL